MQIEIKKGRLGYISFCNQTNQVTFRHVNNDGEMILVADEVDNGKHGQHQLLSVDIDRELATYIVNHLIDQFDLLGSISVNKKANNLIDEFSSVLYHISDEYQFIEEDQLKVDEVIKLYDEYIQQC